MVYSTEEAATEFLVLAGQQRLEILVRLAEKKYKIAVMAKELDATVPEVFRNFEKMVKTGLIEKDTDGFYSLTTYGKTICSQIPSVVFISQNKKYFKAHGYGDLPEKFVQRMGGLESGQHVKGFVKVMDKWKQIYKNAEKYIYNVLYEVSYSPDIMDVLISKLKKEVKVRSIFSESAIITEDRKKVLEKNDFRKFIEKGLIERKMKEDVKIVVILNENEACVMFPGANDEADMSEAFYSKERSFHDWCLDYFLHCWENSGAFIESKIKTG